MTTSTFRFASKPTCDEINFPKSGALASLDSYKQDFIKDAIRLTPKDGHAQIIHDALQRALPDDPGVLIADYVANNSAQAALVNALPLKKFAACKRQPTWPGHYRKADKPTCVNKITDQTDNAPAHDQIEARPLGALRTVPFRSAASRACAKGPRLAALDRMATQTNRKFAVITGASSGIGYQLAKQCLEHDLDVLICAEDDGIHRAAESLRTIGPSVTAIQADLATREGCNELIAAIDRPVDALLLNAGVGVGGAFVDTSLDDELRMIALNCSHTVQIAKALVPRMVERSQGRILITGSEVSTAPNPFQAVYGATKAFAMSFGEALRFELEDSGVTVTVLQPGATDTKFFQRADLTDTKVGQAKKDDPALVAKQGFEAMMDGKDSVAGGSFKSRMQTFMNELLPETMKARMAGMVTKHGSAKH